jgi:hypothetical protein
MVIGILSFMRTLTNALTLNAGIQAEPTEAASGPNLPLILLGRRNGSIGRTGKAVKYPFALSH